MIQYAILNNTNIVIVKADVGDEQATTLGVPDQQFYANQVKAAC